MTEIKKKRKKKKKKYFTKVHEQKILEYVATDCLRKKTKLYIEYIQPVFNEMVDKIVYTFKFNSLPNSDVLREECKIWLVTILDKFDPTKGHKAFSYFSVITKNWFIYRAKKHSKKLRSEIQYEDFRTALDNPQHAVENEYIRLREEKEFFILLCDKVDTWKGQSKKENETKVLEAIQILFDNIDSIEIFNKKAIYLYLREITGLNTKQIVSNLNKIRAKYRDFKINWDDE
jgi:hypothetical protein